MQVDVDKMKFSVRITNVYQKQCNVTVLMIAVMELMKRVVKVSCLHAVTC